MSWDGLIVQRFRCGHQMAGENIERATVRGKVYERCRECHRAACRAWWVWFRSLA